ncbi:MAG: hypothetical protein Q4C30_02605 [Bacteroidia bacterium]|nr:hypothetical protein [Bacteroidia bacterium]
MKRILIASIVTIITLIAACTGKTTPNKYKVVVLPDSIVKAPYINDIVKELDSGLIGSRISAKDRVTNVKQSGKHCMLSNGESAIRLDAVGNIMGFNKELIGNEMVAYGMLCERRFYIEELLRMRQNYIECIERLQSDTTSNNECEKIVSDLQDVNTMYKWTIDNNKPYYSILSIETEEYTILN